MVGRTRCLPLEDVANDALAINGIVECFAYAHILEDRINRYHAVELCGKCRDMQELVLRPLALWLLFFVNNLCEELIRNAVRLFEIACIKLEKLHLIVLHEGEADSVEIR